MVSAYDLIIEAYLEKARRETKIESLPKSPALRANKLAEMYKHDENMLRYLNFYTFLKTILKNPQNKREEYRRHVTLIVGLECSTAEVSIDTLTNCEKFMHSFYEHARDELIGKPDEDDL